MPDARKLLAPAAGAPLPEILVGLTVFLSAYLSMLLTYVPGGITLFWPANGIAASLLVRLPTARVAPAAILSVLAVFLALLTHRTWQAALLFAAINGAEIALMAAAFRLVWKFPYPDITINQAVTMTAVSGVALPGLVAVAAGFILHGQLGIAVAGGAEQWWSAHTIGACLVGPPVILFSAASCKRLLNRHYRLENALTLILILLGSYLLIRYVRFPFAGIGALLLTGAFRLEGFGTSVAGLATGVLVMALWVLGIRPVGLEAAGDGGTLIGLPVVALLAAVMPPVAVGIGVAARRTTLRALRMSERRFRESEAALAGERERLRVTVNSISEAVVTLDAQLRIVFINESAQRLLALDAQAAGGRRIDEVIHLTNPDTAKSVASLAPRCALHGKGMRRESPCILHRADGVTCYVMDSASPLLDSSGQLTGIVLALRDATADVERTRELRERATFDPLTGLVNRAEFHLRLRDAWHKARHLDRPAALLAIDLDRFKALNDTAGHAAGDAMLRRVAEVCRLRVRSADTVARLGGDEFAIILNNCAPDRVERITRQILQALNPLEIEWEGARRSVGASIGVATVSGEMISEVDWMEAADKACYQAKSQGRGQVRVARG